MYLRANQTKAIQVYREVRNSLPQEMKAQFDETWDLAVEAAHNLQAGAKEAAHNPGEFAEGAVVEADEMAHADSNMPEVGAGFMALAFVLDLNPKFLHKKSQGQEEVCNHSSADRSKFHKSSWYLLAKPVLMKSTLDQIEKDYFGSSREGTVDALIQSEKGITGYWSPGQELRTAMLNNLCHWDQPKTELYYKTMLDSLTKTNFKIPDDLSKYIVLKKSDRKITALADLRTRTVTTSDGRTYTVPGESGSRTVVSTQ